MAKKRHLSEEFVDDPNGEEPQDTSEPVKKRKKKKNRHEEKATWLFSKPHAPLHTMFPYLRLVLFLHLQKDNRLNLYRGLTKLQEETAEKCGIKIIKGERFSEKEVKRLKKCFKKCFMSHVMNVESPEEKIETLLDVLGIFVGRGNKSKYLMDKNCKTKFYMDVGRKFPERSLCAIYKRCRSLLTPLKTSKKLTQEEKEEVVEMSLSTKFNESSIGELLEIDPKTVNSLLRRRVTESKERAKLGFWSPEEDQRLLKILCEVLRVENVHQILDKYIPWAEVSGKMKTRTALQCSSHFSSTLCWRIGGDRELDLILSYTESDKKWDMAKLLYFLKREKDTTEDDIDWNRMTLKFPHLSMRTLMKYWEKLKSQLPDERKTNDETTVCTGDELSPSAASPLRKWVKWLFKHHLSDYIDVNEDNLHTLKSFYDS